MTIIPRFLIPLLAVAGLAFALQHSAGDEIDHFVSCQGDKLFVGEQEFRFVSFNIPNLHLVEDNFSFSKPTPWRWPNEYEITDALESVRQMGGTVVRIYVLSVHRENSDMGDHVFVRGPGDFNDEAFQVLDKVLAIARKKGIRVIIPLVDNWHWWGGCAEYAKFRGKQPDDFWTDEQIIADFEATIRHTLNRKNSVHGIPYRDDPTIFGWETGNELDSPSEWTRRISAFIKSIDSKHLVIDGYALHGVRQASLDDPNIDVITTHHYPNTDDDYVQAILKARQMTAGIKPYFVGEFGFIPAEEMQRVLDTVIEHDISGALLWSLRFHNRDGGFYWHWETASNGLYKAYHWPGFDSGAGYEESQILSLMRNKAFAIRGKIVPDRDPPVAPKLLPFTDIGSISWQGSAGAESYNVERSANSQGPWTVVGNGVSDADVQYRPLFNDVTTAVGQTYFYRLLAINSSGNSPPSNVVGPVEVRWKVLVDECRNTDILASHRGTVDAVGDHERKTQEDIHRLRLSPGSSITYQVDQPINSWTAYLFSDNQDPDILVECSSDGQPFSACKTERQSLLTKAGDYGYSIPLLLKGSIEAEGVTQLRISRPGMESTGATKSSVQISRVEIRYGGRKQESAQQPATTPSKVDTRGATLNPSILLFHKPYHTSGVAAVQRAAELRSKCVNVVVTLQCEIDKNRQVARYGVLHRGRFVPLNKQVLAEFQETIRQTFSEAVSHDMDIAILAHLNARGDLYDWRNNFQFDPLERYYDYSYKDALIDPIIRALSATAKETTHIEFMVAGEMGQSVFSHADSYSKIFEELRSNGTFPRMDIGISLNFNHVAGEKPPASIRLHDIQTLINSSDFVGLSNYRWFELPPDSGDFAMAVEQFLKEMRSKGVVIPDGMPLHFSEIGIGGCTKNERLTTSPAVAALTPWEGSDRIARNPWKPLQMRNLRVSYHKALLDFLKYQPTKHPVTKAFLWSEGSWDPMGIDDAHFADAEIIALIQQHNDDLTDGR